MSWPWWHESKIVKSVPSQLQNSEGQALHILGVIGEPARGCLMGEGKMPMHLSHPLLPMVGRRLGPEPLLGIPVELTLDVRVVNKLTLRSA